MNQLLARKKWTCIASIEAASSCDKLALHSEINKPSSK
jgi:hypothetical protein